VDARRQGEKWAPPGRTTPDRSKSATVGAPIFVPAAVVGEAVDERRMADQAAGDVS